MEWIRNEELTARMDGYTAEGSGVCHAEGRAVFVPGALKGEVWRIRLVKVTGSAVWGRGMELLEPSGARQDSDCPAYPRCGGCSLRHMRYEEELSMKLQRVNDALHRIGGLDFSIGEILAAGEEARRRRKVIFNVGEQDGHPVAGFFRSRSHEIIPCPDCAAVPEASLRVRSAVLAWMEAQHIPVYDESANKEGVRHIFFRSSHKNETAVVTLTASCLLKKGDTDALIVGLRKTCPEVIGLVFNLNRARGNTVLAGEFRTLWGESVLEESLCSLTFSLSPRAFFQVNPPQAERLYDRALDYAGIREGMTALDLYCGTGTIGLCMAARGASVIGAEVIEAAVENARENALRNGLRERCEFVCADAGEAAQLFRDRGITPAVIMVDPPRKGLDGAVIDAAVNMVPERIVYVSCDPGTLARDLHIFAEKGYLPGAGTCVDMFPRTAHVETVVLMERTGVGENHPQ